MAKKILKVLGGLIAVFVVVGVFLPSAYQVERTIKISAPPELVFEHVNHLKLSESWSPWGEGDDTMKIVYAGPESGIGAKGTWTSEKSGNGSQTITRSTPHSLIEIALDFGDEGQGTAEYLFEPEGEALKVTWRMYGDVGFSLIGRYFALGMDGMLGPYFDKGLTKLQQVTEAKAESAKAEAQVAAEENVNDRSPIRVGGLQTPESVLHDAIDDVYLVSNINGTPFAADDNGFITRIGPDGSILEFKWIDGASDAVTLNAPKGMTISGDTLYVADINSVRMFERATGAPKGEIAIKGATFLNGMTTGPDGVVYVSDSGLKEGFTSNGTDAVYKLVDGKAVALIKNKDLGGPNGLLALATGVWVVTFGSGELYFVGPDGARSQAQKLPSGALDGIVQLNDGAFAISSWEGSSVLRGTPGQSFEVMIADAPAPADIGYDSKRNRVLIPHFQDNAVQFRPL